MRAIAILLILVSFAGCCKEEWDDDEPKDPISRSGIVGRWELSKSVGGITGTINYPVGNGNIYQFRTNGTYSHSMIGFITQQGSFEVEETTTYGVWKLIMTTSTSSTTKTVRISYNDLIFLKESDCCDYPDTYFVPKYY